MTTTNYERAVDTLWKDFKELRTDLKAVIDALHSTARERVRDHVDDARNRASEAATRGAERVREAAASAAQAGQNALQRVRTTVEERPVLSLLAAIGIGALIGGLFHRRMAR